MSIIFIFGPSCSGKSTLAKALQKTLGSGWTRIDRDKLINLEICTDLTADATLDIKIETIKSKIIIDAQIPWRKRREGEFYFIALPPIEFLLKRDSERTIKLQRSLKQAQLAQQYVLETYNKLKAIDQANFDRCLDSSQLTVTQEVNTVINYIYTSNSLFSLLLNQMLDR